MSKSPAIRPKEGPNPRSTRQLLDELDDLMNQMLSLPVEDEPESAPALTKAATKTSKAKAKAPPPKAALAIEAPKAVSATLTMIEPDQLPLPRYSGGEGRGEGDSIPTAGEIPSSATSEPIEDDIVTCEEMEPSRGISPSPPTPLTRSTGGEGRPIPIHRLEPVDDEDSIEISDDSLVESAPFIPFHRESRPMPRSSASWLVRTLVVWDRGFRRVTRRFGPLGWVMRSSFGRTLLGLSGLACWIIALAWLIKDWMEWPR